MRIYEKVVAQVAISLVEIKAVAAKNFGGVILFGSIGAAFVSGVALAVYFSLAYPLL